MIVFFLKILLFGSMVATVIILGFGIFSMVSGKAGYFFQSNKMMQLRIFFQLVAIIIFSLLLFLRASAWSG